MFPKLVMGHLDECNAGKRPENGLYIGALGGMKKPPSCRKAAEVSRLKFG
jgi:hypothetical protein